MNLSKLKLMSMLTLCGFATWSCKSNEFTGSAGTSDRWHKPAFFQF
jgi:hypothetical protein